VPIHAYIGGFSPCELKAIWGGLANGQVETTGFHNSVDIAFLEVDKVGVDAPSTACLFAFMLVSERTRNPMIWHRSMFRNIDAGQNVVFPLHNQR
jgi:hypothetical protein